MAHWDNDITGLGISQNTHGEICAIDYCVTGKDITLVDTGTES